MMDDFNELGPAEAFAAKQLREAIKEAHREAVKLAEAFNEIDCDLIEEAILDPERRKSLIELVPTVQKLPSNLGMTALIPMIVDVILKPKETASA